MSSMRPLALALLISAVFFAGCQKTYTCTCANTCLMGPLPPPEIPHTIEAKNAGDAGEKCEEKESDCDKCALK